MKLRYDNTRTRTEHVIDDGVVLEGKSMIELFDELYEKQNNQPMNDEQRAIMLDVIGTVDKEV